MYIPCPTFLLRSACAGSHTLADVHNLIRKNMLTPNSIVEFLDKYVRMYIYCVIESKDLEYLSYYTVKRP